ncbi:hypothetical protein Ancab_033501 [Ancistrocladus abbreviatus]
MEIAPLQPYAWDILLNPPFPFPYNYQIPDNYVHWTETSESHIYSADILGVRKEEIKVEVEDSRYLIIRTESVDQLMEPARRFMRKFRLPGMIDIDGISAGYENGVSTVTVPRAHVRRGFYIDPADLTTDNGLELTARARIVNNTI